MHADRLLLLGLSAALASCASGRHGPVRWVHAERVLEAPLPITAGEELDVETAFGSVAIDTTDGPARVIATVRAQAESAHDARRLADSAELDVTDYGSRVAVRVSHAARNGIQDVVVEFRLAAPAGVRVRARSTAGAIRVTGPLSDCDAETRFGTVDVELVRGSVRALSGSGDVSVRSARASTVLAETRFGSVVVEDVEATVAATATTGSGSVEIRNVDAPSVEVTTDFGTLRARGVRGALRASTRSGSVSVDDFDGKSIDVESMYGPIDVRGLLRAVTVRGTSGDVRIRARQGSSCVVPWSVSTRFGNVDLVLPRAFGADARLTARHGVVTTDVPVAVSEARVGGQGTVITRIGDGGASLDVETDSGSIVVRRRDP